MPEMRVFANPHEARAFEPRLVDPRRIGRIILIATASEPPIQGFPNERVFPISSWKATNADCGAVLGDSAHLALDVHIGPGDRIDELVELALGFAATIRSAAAGLTQTHIQFKKIPAYPANRSGPREFALLTVSFSDEFHQSCVHIIGGDALVPVCDMTGTALVQSSPAEAIAAPLDDDLAAHLSRNEEMWAAWSALGVSEKTCLQADFHFAEAPGELAAPLMQFLTDQGFQTSAVSRRSFFRLKGQQVTAAESAWWTLDRLQWRTRQLYEAGAKWKVGLDGVGAAIPAAPAR